MKPNHALATVLATAALITLASCAAATTETPAPAPTAYESLTALALPLTFESGSAPANITSTAGYLNAYTGALATTRDASSFSAANHRTMDYTGAGSTAWVAATADSFTVGTSSLGFEYATSASDGRVVLSLKKLTMGTLTSTGGLQFDLALPLNNTGVTVYLRATDAKGTVVTEYNALLNGGFNPADDWNWYFDPSDHWTSFKVPFAKFTSGASGAGTLASAVAATTAFNQIDIVFRLTTSTANGIVVGDKEKGWIDNVSVY